jgi:hypothetical protein
MGIALDPANPSLSHPSEEILEEYLFHRLPEAVTAPVEEHLLTCHRCQDLLRETEQFISAMNVAARRAVPSIGPARSVWRTNPDAIPRYPHPSTSKATLASVFALTLLTVVVFRKHQAQEIAVPVSVTLSSLRGAVPASPASAGKPLRLNIEAPDIALGQYYRGELVDAAGRPVWNGAVTAVSGVLTMAVLTPLPSGVYWVRLYGADSELLREFGLALK